MPDKPGSSLGENGDGAVHGRGRRQQSAFSLERDAWGRLVLIDQTGQRIVGIEAVRAFPYSDPEHWVSLCDAEGREVACVESLDELDAAERQVIEDELALREFVPIIKHILRVSADSTPCTWDVETDRGPTRFTLNSDDDVRRLGPERALVSDVQGIRYLIPDTRALDGASRRLLERYL